MNNDAEYWKQVSIELAKLLICQHSFWTEDDKEHRCLGTCLYALQMARAVLKAEDKSTEG